MNIIQKIYFREHAIFFLQTNQFFQLVSLNRMILAPYYSQRLKKQGKEVADAENFAAIYGKNRWEYENGI